MRIPFLCPAVSFALGVVYASWHPLPVEVLFLLCGLSTFFLWFLRGKRHFIFLFSFGMMFAGSLFSVIDTSESPCAIASFVSESRIHIEGIVSSLPEVKQKKRGRVISFDLDVTSTIKMESGQQDVHQAQGKVRVHLYSASQTPGFGDTVRLWGNLQKPRPAKNPGAFDYAAHLKHRKIAAVFYSYGP